MKKIIILLAVAVLFTVLSCGDKECDCNPKAHLGIGETCSCGTECTCTEQTAVIAGTSITIRKQSGVTVAQMNSAVEALDEVYRSLNATLKDAFKNNITEIHIGGVNTNISHAGKVMTIGYDDTGDTIVPYLMSQGLLAYLNVFDHLCQA